MGRRDAPQHLVVGHLNKAHGTKGEVFIWPLTDHPESTFAPGVVLFLGDTEGGLSSDRPTTKVETSRAYRRGYLVRFEGVSDRRGAQDLCGRYVLRGIEDVDDLEEGEVFYHQLLGMDVFTVEDERVGEVVEVYELRPSDVLEVRGPEKDIMIPFIPEMIRTVDVERNRIVIDPPDGLLDI